MVQDDGAAGKGANGESAKPNGKAGGRTKADLVRIIAGWLRLFVPTDGVTEVRGLDVEQRYGRACVESGYFDHEHLPEAADEAIRLSKVAKGVYFCPNPIMPDLLARRANRMDRVGENEATNDKHIVSRRWLLIDADPKRPDAKISATDEEKAQALVVIQSVRDFLRERGWPESVFADSGNGYHADYRIDLPVDDGGLVKRVLLALAQRFGTPAVTIDQTLVNPSRLIKLYGSIARKGDNVPKLNRLHRHSQVLEVPGCPDPTDTTTADVRIVPAELLKALAAEAKEETKTPPPGPTPSTNGNGYDHRLLVDKWLNARGVAFRVKPAPVSGGRTAYLITCPFDASHTGGDTCIMQATHGALSAHCFHNSCSDRGWQEFKEQIGKPDGDHYEPPLNGKKTRGPKQEAKPGARATNDAGSDSTKAATPDTAIEGDDDPHRLARLYVKQNQYQGHLNTLVFWREEWHRWESGAYRCVPSKEVGAELTRCTKAEFDRLNIEAQIQKQRQKAEDGGSSEDDGAKPKDAAKAAAKKKKKARLEAAAPVTTKLTADIRQALTDLCLLPSTVVAPAWLCPDDGWAAEDVLACKNGLVHLPSLVAKKDHLISPSPLFFSPNALDYDFDSNAPKPTAWLEFLGKIWPKDPESIQALQEWFGYCLLPDTRQQKILMAVGPKRSGKGTIARILARVVGMANVCGPTLAGLGSNFGLWPLLGKTVAIISDARLSRRSDIATITERLLSISGEDAQTIDRKNLSQITCKLAVRFVILTNELPRLNDPSGALVGRLVMLRMTESWYGREDTRLTDSLLPELPGILLWSIAGWERLRDRGHFIQPHSSLAVVRDLEDLSSPMGAFVRDLCVVGPDESVPVQDLYGRWKLWCGEKGWKETGTEQAFGRDLRAVVAGLDVQQPRDPHDQTRRIRVYKGVRLKKPEEIKAEDAAGGD